MVSSYRQLVSFYFHVVMFICCCSSLLDILFFIFSFFAFAFHASYHTCILPLLQCSPSCSLYRVSLFLYYLISFSLLQLHQALNVYIISYCFLYVLFEFIPSYLQNTHAAPQLLTTSNRSSIMHTSNAIHISSPYSTCIFFFVRYLFVLPICNP